MPWGGQWIAKQFFIPAEPCNIDYERAVKPVFFTVSEMKISLSGHVLLR
jgi:hypothetical protein